MFLHRFVPEKLRSGTEVTAPPPRVVPAGGSSSLCFKRGRARDFPKNFLRASCRNPHPSLWPGTPPPQGSSPRPIHPTPSPGVFQVQMKHRMHHQRGPHTLNKANAHFMDGPTANLQPNALFSRLKHSSAQRNSSEFVQVCQFVR